MLGRGKCLDVRFRSAIPIVFCYEEVYLGYAAIFKAPHDTKHGCGRPRLGTVYLKLVLPKNVVGTLSEESERIVDEPFGSGPSDLAARHLPLDDVKHLADGLRDDNPNTARAASEVVVRLDRIETVKGGQPSVRSAIECRRDCMHATERSFLL
ncbi:hypothetical protein Y600_5999 [Burkholderia pseudomallei MSHR3709]|nr:hypothetical protein Y600_5999 [Burkholderia pseudomallei MSHR3709]